MLSSGVIKCHRLRRGGSPVSRRYCRLKYATSAYPSADAIRVTGIVVSATTADRFRRSLIGHYVQADARQVAAAPAQRPGAADDI